MYSIIWDKKISIIHLSMPFRNLLSFTGMRNKHKWGFSRRRDNIAFHWRDTIELDLEGYSGFKTVEKLSREREREYCKQRPLSGKRSGPYKYQQGVNCSAILITIHQAVTQYLFPKEFLFPIDLLKTFKSYHVRKLPY